ncbi:glucose-1-phosphate thymidylyltransferase [candidate division KSB3 bacterium]|uniref:Glucose-1-phosphate thymidylyltransferase n=1 Tax=candidate division KSB3 bacterium TaxID=2044937 RepID=A0A9D5JWE4_9BACT|nr:glucose-1-phosphate thymidylyltransferase [candidate division KSB3 bacterium]MBD3325524.1 glucose-1-phosphate thymidylyltransferase [candidate division KSB3 bacterium]
MTNFAHRELFADLDGVWEVLKRLPAYIEQILHPQILGTVAEGASLVGDQIQIGNGSVIEPGAYIAGPTIIGEHTIVRHGAYIRGNVIVGDHCVVGHASELKGSILFDHSGAPHFNYVGDSILGNHVNLGAGTKLSNLKMLKGSVHVKMGQRVYDSGLRKFGAILGDRAETGCNAILNPGTLIGPGSLVYPNITVSGYIPPHSIVKLRQTQEVVPYTQPT